MNALLSGWYVDASPGAASSSAKCGEKFSSVGISGVSKLPHPIASAITMADTIVLNSFPYLVGKTVSVCLGGLDCGDFIVAADGSLTIPYASDPGALLTPQYLVAISGQSVYGDLEAHIRITDSEATVTDVYVPLVVGYAYTSQGQMLRAVTQEEMKSAKGPGTGRLRRIFKFSFLVWNAAKVKMGTSFTHLMTQKLLYPDRATELPSNVPFTGVHEATIDDASSFDGQLCWQVDRPFPLGVVSTTTFVNSEDR